MIVTELTADDTDMVPLFRDAESELMTNISNEHLRFRLAKSNVRRGIRWSSYHSYLRPSFQRPNLHIAYSTRVRRINFYDGKAAAVSVSAEGAFDRAKHIFARREIIISAGAYQTPQILKLSGIGPAQELRQHKIRVYHDSPKVGTNLYDHMNLPLYVSINASISVTLEKMFNVATLWEYLWYGGGLLSQFGVTGFVSDGNSGVGVFGVGTIDEAGMRDVSNYLKDVCAITLFLNCNDYNCLFLFHRHFVANFHCMRTSRKKVW